MEHTVWSQDMINSKFIKKDLQSRTILQLFFLVFISLISFSVQSSSNLVYSVVKITDGDTFVATDGNIKFRVRIAGLDAPESSQEYGKVSKEALASLIDGKLVSIRPVGSGLDMYGRVLAQVLVGNKDVGVDMIEQGLATYYRPKCVDYPLNKSDYDYDPRPYVDAEGQAKIQKKNIWAVSGMILPCEFRKKKLR